MSLHHTVCLYAWAGAWPRKICDLPEMRSAEQLAQKLLEVTTACHCAALSTRFLRGAELSCALITNYGDDSAPQYALNKTQANLYAAQIWDRFTWACRE